MNTKRLVLSVMFLLLLGTLSWADPVTLSATGGVGTGKDTYTVSGVTFGSSLTFEYQFLAGTTWAGSGSPFLNVNGKDLIDFADFNDYQSGPTGLLLGMIDTSSVAGSTGDVVFTADTFNAVGNKVNLLVQNVKVDGELVALSSAAVPEPCSLILLGSGIVGIIARKRKLRA